MRTKELANFIRKRDEHRLVREGVARWVGVCKPDPIIAKYRFCNVVRADDRVTKFILKWGAQWVGDPDQWFAFVVARLFNNSDTLTFITKAVLPFKPEVMRQMLQFRKDKGFKIFNAAYIVSTNGISMDKVDYVIDIVLKPLWDVRKAMRPKVLTTGNKSAKSKTLQYEPWASWHSRLQGNRGMGSFMAAQVVADLKYMPPFFDARIGIPTSATEDWWTFAASGPGSRRGLNRVVGYEIDKGWREQNWRSTLTELHNQLRPLLPPAIGTRLSAQDVQNCLCEFDKYERARLGEGAPKQIFTPSKEPLP